MSLPVDGPRVPPLMALLVALITIGCNGGGGDPAVEAGQAGPGASPQAGDNRAGTAGVQGYACSDLLSEQEIDQMIGLSGTRRVTDIRGDENDILPGHTQCGYSLPQDFTLGINVYSGAGSGEALETFDVVWNRAQSDGAQPLSGLGDSALTQPEFPAGPRVLARARGRGVVVGGGDLSGGGQVNLNEMINRVAEIVVGRV